MLSIGQEAPNFSLLDENSSEQNLSDYKGQWVVLYFYPKDNTSGCTQEACAIAEVYDEFMKLGVKVMGVSKDSPASHIKFKEKHNLPFTLLSDETTKVIEKYGAWVEKSMYGKKYMGTQRITYIIDPDGKITFAYPKVTPADHALQLLSDLKTALS